jgi:aspartyl aminopeptidase
VMGEAITRVCGCFTTEEEIKLVSLRHSFLVSADVAHALHPNYASKHESNHQPKLNGGTVLKTNDNQRYATHAATGFVVREVRISYCAQSNLHILI